MVNEKIPPIELPTLYTTEEVADMLKVSTRTLQNYRDKGLLGYIKIAGRILYKEEQIKALLESSIQVPYAQNFHSLNQTAL